MIAMFTFSTDIVQSTHDERSSIVDMAAHRPSRVSMHAAKSPKKGTIVRFIKHNSSSFDIGWKVDIVVMICGPELKRLGAAVSKP